MLLLCGCENDTPHAASAFLFGQTNSYSFSSKNDGFGPTGLAHLRTCEDNCPDSKNNTLSHIYHIYIESQFHQIVHITMPTGEFIGDGAFKGDGGENLQRLWDKYPWRPVKDQPGRYSMKRVGDGIPPQALVESSGVATSPIVRPRKNLSLIEVEGGGGLVTEEREGVYFHTLQTRSSFDSYRKNVI